MRLKYERRRISNLEDIYQLDFSEKAINTDITGNGFLTYKIVEIPEIEVNDNFILPHNASIQTDDEIRKSAKEQFLSIK